MSASHAREAPRKSIAARLLSFTGLIWLMGALAIVWLLVAPLAWNAWAAGHWLHRDCHLRDQGASYSYMVDGKEYLSDRRDFWQVIYSNGPARSIPSEPLEFDSRCWVNPHNPVDSVLFLDATSNFTNSTGRFFDAGLVLLAVIGMTFLGRKKFKRVPPPSVPERTL